VPNEVPKPRIPRSAALESPKSIASRRLLGDHESQWEGALANAWIVRTGSDDLDTLQLTRGVIALGWGTTGDLSRCRTPDQIREQLALPDSDIGPKQAESLVLQLFAFARRIQQGDLVVAPLSTGLRVAIAEVTGPYLYDADLAPDGLHVREARWLRDDVSRRSIGPDLLDGSPLNTISKIMAPDAVERIRYLVRHDQDKALAGVTRGVGSTARSDEDTPSAFDNLKHNLDLARSLAEAGKHFSELGASLFEVDDIFRAAWVQAVAALDHWVRQEVHTRMLELAKQWQPTRPSGFSKFEVTMDTLEDVYRRGVPLYQALDRPLWASLSRTTYQRPERIREGFSLVCDTNRLWDRVAETLDPRTLDQGRAFGPRISGKDVRQRLDDIVERRNKIAHEYDADPDAPQGKRPIDAASTTAIIDWIERLAAALRDVVEQDTPPKDTDTGTDG